MQKSEKDLATSFRRLAESLQQLAESLRDLSGKMGEPIYKHHDMPFGPTREAQRLWIRFGQYTTRN